MEKVFESDCIILEYDPTTQIFYQKWIGNIEDDVFMQAIDLTLKCSYDFKISKILSDTQKHNNVSVKAVNYAAGTVPELKANGLTKMAFLNSESKGTEAGVKRFHSISHGVEIQHFAQTTQAIEWLNETSAEKKNSAFINKLLSLFK